MSEAVNNLSEPFLRLAFVYYLKTVLQSTHPLPVDFLFYYSESK